MLSIVFSLYYHSVVTVFHDDIDNKGKEGGEGRERRRGETVFYPRTDSLPIFIAYGRMLGEVNNVSTSNSDAVSLSAELSGQPDQDPLI